MPTKAIRKSSKAKAPRAARAPPGTPGSGPRRATEALKKLCSLGLAAETLAHRVAALMTSKPVANEVHLSVTPVVHQSMAAVQMMFSNIGAVDQQQLLCS